MNSKKYNYEKWTFTSKEYCFNQLNVWFGAPRFRFFKKGTYLKLRVNTLDAIVILDEKNFLRKIDNYGVPFTFSPRVPRKITLLDKNDPNIKYFNLIEKLKQL